MKIEAALSILSVRLNQDPKMRLEVSANSNGMKTAVLVRNYDTGIGPMDDVSHRGQGASLGGAIVDLANATQRANREAIVRMATDAAHL